MSADYPSAEETAAALSAVLGQVYRRIKQTKALGDLTLPESSALSQLRHGPRTAAELAKLERITPQSIGATVAALEQRGLIERSPDPTDGRRQLLSLTPQGSGTVSARRAHRDRQFIAALEQFSQADRQRLLDALPLLTRLTDELSEEAT